MPPKRQTETETRPSSFTSLLLGWTQQGIDSVLATQRILADFATRKGTSAIKSLREGMSDTEHSPVAILSEIALEGTANLTEAQRVLLTLLEQENGIVMEGVMERLGGSRTATSVVQRLRRGIDTLVDTQQNFLTIASKHAQDRLKDFKAGKGADPACLLDTARESMENFVRAQKKILDILVEEEEAPKHKGGKAAEAQKTEVSELARQAASSFIDAQKSLLDLAGQQMNVTLETASRGAEMVNMMKLSPFPAFTGNGVKSFVEAEKAVLDSIMKPPNGKSAKTEGGAKRPARRRKASAAKAVVETTA